MVDLGAWFAEDRRIAEDEGSGESPAESGAEN
jgi:endogenous inhibitor of DNA gyrase (YacG/DUF329 family)